MRKMEITNKKIQLTDDVENIMEKTVTRYGNGAKLDCQKKYIGKRAYIVILKR